MNFNVICSDSERTQRTSGAKPRTPSIKRAMLGIGEPTARRAQQVSAADFADIWDHSSPHEDSADPLVLGGVSDDHGQAWRTWPASAAPTRSVLLRDRVDDAAQTPPSDGE